jgi:predicted nuclease with TOPRIM domain
MKIEVSNGEILDKFTILEIKKSEIKDAEKLKNVEKEYSILKEHVVTILNTDHELYKKLLEINKKLWKIEDDIRICERNANFGPKFIELARAVYIVNDERADVKKQINLLTGSNVIEEKSYEKIS